MEALTCKNCGAPIPPENILNDGEIAVCKYCNTVLHLSEEHVPFPEKPKRHEKEKRKLPDKFIFEQHPDGVELQYRWLGKQHWALLLFTIFWDGFIVFWIAIALASGAFMMILFGGLHILIGIFLAYYVLTGFLNRTTIMIRPKGVKIHSAPLPSIGMSDKIIDRRNIEQVYCTRRVAYTSNDVPVYVFDVHYVEKGGGEETLVKGLDQLNKAIYVEQQIERIYKIEDRPVDDEYQSPYV